MATSDHRDTTHPGGGCALGARTAPTVATVTPPQVPTVGHSPPVTN
ncbi:MAG TPA: hypothetical protein VGA66_12400 [Mycobacterium sp.]|jgi:hypothetical protein